MTPSDSKSSKEKDDLKLNERVENKDQEAGQEHVVPGADEYQLMVAHFADAVLAKTELMYPPADSIANMRVLDALAQAARTGETVKL